MHKTNKYPKFTAKSLKIAAVTRRDTFSVAQICLELNFLDKDGLPRVEAMDFILDRLGYQYLTYNGYQTTEKGYCDRIYADNLLYQRNLGKIYDNRLIFNSKLVRLLSVLFNNLYYREKMENLINELHIAS